MNPIKMEKIVKKTQNIIYRSKFLQVNPLKRRIQKPQQK